MLKWNEQNHLRIGAFHNAQVVLSIPSVVIGCEPRSGYASVHICWPTHWHFCLLADTSWATELVTIVYYFLLYIRAVASSNNNNNNLFAHIWFHIFLSFANNFQRPILPVDVILKVTTTQVELTWE